MRQALCFERRRRKESLSSRACPAGPLAKELVPSDFGGPELQPISVMKRPLRLSPLAVSTLRTSSISGVRYFQLPVYGCRETPANFDLIPGFVLYICSRK